MRTFNLVKSLTRVINNRKGLLILCLSLATFGVNEAWGGDVKYKVTVKASPVGKGKVYANNKEYYGEVNFQKTGLKSGSASCPLKAEESEGYTFSNWAKTSGSGSVGNGGNREATVSTTTSSSSDVSVEVTAYFTANTYTVTFDAGANSTASKASKSVTFDSPYGDLATTSRAGLEGWYTDKTGGSKVETTTTVTTANSHTLYARYNYYAKATSLAVSNVEGDAGGGTYISINGGTPSESSSYREENYSVKTIVSYNENPTTASYFAAQAKTGFKFIGWYSDKEHTQLVSSDKVYQPTITVKSNNSNSPTTLSLYAYFEVQWPTYYGKAFSYSVESQTGYTWVSMRGTTFNGNFTSDVSDNSHQEGKFASAPTFPCVFYASPKDGYAFAGWFDNAECTGAPLSTSTANWCNYNENLIATSTEENNPTTIHRYAKFAPVTVSEATAQMVNFTAQTQTQTATLTFAVTNADAKADFNEPIVTSGDAGWMVKEWNYANNQVTVVVSFTATENTTTLGDHTATVTLTAKSGNSATGQVTAHIAMTPVYTCTIADKYLVDDNAIDLNTLWTSTSNGAKHYSIVSFTESGINNDGATTPALNGTALSLGQAGTVKLKLTQDAGTSSVAGAEQTKTITVSKRDNAISSSFASSMFMDAKQNGAISSNNSITPITATQTAGNTIATLNDAQNQVTSNYNLGDATWTVSQSENYKYKAANASFTINVGLAPREKCLTLEIADAVELEGHGKNPKEYDITLGKDLTFKAKRSATGIGTLMIDIYVGNQWVNIFDKNPGKVIETIIGIESEVDYDTYSVLNIDSTATKIKFYTSSLADYKKYYKNVEITRRSYLNASDFTINTQSDNTTLVYPGKTGTGSFHVDYSLANGGDLKIVCDNPKFTIDKTTQTDVDCKSGSFNVNMTYTSQTAGTDYAHVVIYNNVYRKEITVTGITQKHQQTLNWKANFDQMSKGGEEKNAATSSHGLVTYKSSNPNAIRVDNDANGNATILVAVAKGESKITATAAGDDEYEEISIEKTISVTEKCVQYIVWTQSLMGLKLNDPNRILNAYATSEIEECTSNNGGRLVTYTSDDESVVKVVNTNELQIVGVGTTTVTAHQAGGLDSDGHDYEPATKENTVVVKDPSAKCEAFVYEQNGDAEQFFAMNTSEITGTEHTLSGEPAKITFRAKREYWNLAINYSKGNIVLDAYTPTGGWQQVLDCGEPPIGSYQEYSKELSRDVTKIRFRRPSGGQGYHYIADAKVEMLRYIETSTPSTFQANVGEQQQQTIYLSYSNITSDLLLSMASGANSHFSVDKTQITGDCGAVAKNVALTISYAPTKNTEELGEETETLIISDGTTTTNVALKGTANRVARSIVWDINDQNTVYTVQTVNLNATAKTNLQQEAGNVAYNINPSSTEGCGSINNNVLSFAKAGNVSVVATTIEDAKYLPAVAVTKSWTVSLTPTKVVTKPEIDGDIIYGAQLDDLKLKANTGSARNTVNQQPVEGTFSITGGDLSAAGEKTITVTFTPANTDMYASCTSSVPVTIQKAEPDAHAHASEIIYGVAVKTSVLTNDGTTAGTWTWTDEKKDQVLEVGTHEGLNVHFSPTDKTNYNEIDGTVSLTVKKAQATLTWTNEPTSADVKDKLTYAATSNHSESTIIYAITGGTDCATIDANTGELTITKAGTITVQASQDATTHYEAAEITVTTTLTGEFENVFSGEGDWNDPENWTYGVPTSENPDIVVSGSLTISEPISVGGLTIEEKGKVTIVGNGDLTVNGTSGDRETYGNLFVRNGGDVTISENADVKVFDFVVESSIGTEGQSISGQVKHSERVIYTNGAYIDIYMDQSGKMDDTQWYGFTVPFPVDVQSGIARKEGDTFRKCTYGVEYMICEYDINQRLNTGKGWKYIKSGQLQPGRFYYFTVNGDYNVYSFKAAENTITINNTTELRVNGEGPNANWNAVGNTTLTYATISGEKVPAYVQTYVNGESRYITVATDDAQFVVGCPFFFQASEETTMILNETNETVDAHYAPRQESLDKPVCVRIAEEGKHFSDQIYLTASQEATDEYTLGRDLAKAGIGTKSAQLWMNAYGQKLSVQDATLMGEQAYYELSIYAPKAGSYELSLPKTPANAVIYLTQDGYPIWNLNEMPYVIECYKGTTNEYGLLLRLQEGGSPTDMQTMRGSEKVQKIMKNQRIYINANTQLYDLMGQKVK